MRAPAPVSRGGGAIRACRSSRRSATARSPKPEVPNPKSQTRSPKPEVEAASRNPCRLSPLPLHQVPKPASGGRIGPSTLTAISPPAPRVAASSPSAPGRRSRTALLAAASPRAILARIVPDDPLELRPRIARALRRHALFLDPDRLFLRAVALCARAAPDWRGHPPLDEWLDAHVEAAVLDRCREEGEASAEPGEPGGAGEKSVFDLLARPLGLDAARARVACRRFHRAPRDDREAFFLLVIERRSLEDAAAVTGCSGPAVARGARRALDLLLAPPPSDPQPPGDPS